MYKIYIWQGNSLVRQNIYNGAAPNLTLGLYSIFHYTAGQLTKEEVFNGYDNSYIHSINHEYDDRNNLTRQYMMSGEYGISGNVRDPNEYKYTKHIYDEKGRETRLEYYNADWLLLHYNNHTQLSKRFHYYDRWNSLTETAIGNDCSLFRKTYRGELLMEVINYNPVWGCNQAGMTRYEYEPD
ncbi:MAG: hypothetical protein LBF62_14615 [Tannerellaceae bacterium]|jgi:hypothetical protein|nr:hypothetical protein [Tannerellaceae bacterium]